ncbi:Uncharacterised protein [Bordetella pertussis]|nr:Uncharacterised protein [Bordetella pertussis]
MPRNGTCIIGTSAIEPNIAANRWLGEPIPADAYCTPPGCLRA